MPFKNKYSLDDYKKAIELREQGFGSLRISKILGYKTRSAIETWINGVMKPYYSSEKRINYCKSSKLIERMREMNKITQPKAVKISAELRTKRLPINAKNLTEELAYVLGVVYCDGHVSIKQRKVILSATDKDFVLNFKNNLEKWSNFKARFYSRNLKKPDYIKTRKLQYVSYIDSKEASMFLKKFNANDLLNATDKIKASFLMGCFDSEGCVFKDKSGLAWYNTNYNLTILINKLLKSLNIYPTIIVRKLSGIGNFKTNKYYYTLSVYKKESIINFYKYIRFSIQRKQERLIKQIDSIKIRMEVQQMEDEISEKVIEKQREDRDNHTVFIGLKPFMKSI